MAHLKVKLVKGFSGRTKIQLANLRGLGLSRREQVVFREDTPSIRGMVQKVLHLVEVEEMEGDLPSKEKA